MARTRRAVLAMGAASLSAVAGCLGGGNNNNSNGGGDGGNNDDGGDGGGNSGPFPDHTDVNDIFFERDETIEIPAGEYHDYEINFEDGGALSYEFTVTSGPAIDVLLIRDGEFGYFEEGHKVNYNSAHSIQEDTEASSSSGISEGTFHLTFDNSEMGRAQPPTPEPTPTATPESTDSAGGDSTATDSTEAESTDEGSESTDEGSESTDASGGASGATATVELSITAGQ